MTIQDVQLKEAEIAAGVRVEPRRVGKMTDDWRGFREILHLRQAFEMGILGKRYIPCSPPVGNARMRPIHAAIVKIND